MWGGGRRLKGSRTTSIRPESWVQHGKCVQARKSWFVLPGHRGGLHRHGTLHVKGVRRSHLFGSCHHGMRLILNRLMICYAMAWCPVPLQRPPPTCSFLPVRNRQVEWRFWQSTLTVQPSCRGSKWEFPARR